MVSFKLMWPKAPSWLQKLVLVLTIWRASAKDLNFAVINGGVSNLVFKWLPGGLSDTGSGTFIGNVPARGWHGFRSGSVGHVFRLENAAHVTKGFAYSGDVPFNVLGVEPAADGTFNVEHMGPAELKSMVIRLHKVCPKQNFDKCASEQANFTNINVVWPPELVREVASAFSPRKLIPVPVAGADVEMSAYGTVPPDEFIIMHALPYPLQLRWAPLVEDPRPGTVVPKAESEVVAKVPAASAGSVPMFRMKAEPGQLFFALSSKASGSKQTRSFVYPGEFAIVSVWDEHVGDSTASGSLLVHVLKEDELKVLLSDVARSCSTLLESGAWQSCLRSGVVLPASGLQIPDAAVDKWFNMLWVSKEHWQLCNHQPGTDAVDSVSLKLEDSSELQGVILRKEPLVLAIKGLATTEECQQMEALGGESMSMAYVSGGSTSRGRRTLSKNLNPDLSNNSSILTQLTYRFFEVARLATGFQLYPEGQEPVNWLFYKPGFEYRPHCDGGCGQWQVARGGRVASSLLYCAVADEGGGTVFPNDGIKLEPSVGDLLMFAYNSDPNSLSYHSACPVVRGRKLTATQWYREGVSMTRNWEKIMKHEL